MTLRGTIFGHIVAFAGALALGYILISSVALKKLYPQLSAPVFPLLGMALGLWIVGVCVAIIITGELLLDAMQGKDVLRERSRAELAHVLICPVYFTVGVALASIHLLVSR